MVNCNGKGNGTEGKDEAYRFGDGGRGGKGSEGMGEEEGREVRRWGEEQGKQGMGKVKKGKKER